MAGRLRYPDAVRLLGGDDDAVLSALDTLAGGVMLGAAAAGFPAVLGWLDARHEVAKLSRDLLRALRERYGTASRYSRTRRLEAAHAVLVVTGYFEALAEAPLPFRFADLELSRAEQAALLGHDPSSDLLRSLLDDCGDLTPGPHEPHEQFLDRLRGYYREVSRAVERFVSGLAVWDKLDHTRRTEFTGVLTELSTRACDRYEELHRRLATDFPELAYWSGQREHRATREQLRQLRSALSDVEALLQTISTGAPPDQRRAGLARANRAALERPVAESGDLPAGLRMPSLRDGYITPAFRVTQFHGEAVSNESWWDNAAGREDLQEFLTGYLTSPRAVTTPLLVLGQPGSGKSVLTKVLAARLPAADFLPVRVPLREVPAAAGPQDQIEYAVREATGERLEWPLLARSAGDALPVVMLDGFDELLQATGVSQSDYLANVEAFQRRESEQGRPVVVVVTSRTSVADRARIPDESVVIRLDPFDESRVVAWLEAWNTVNAGYFTGTGRRPLAPEAVLAHRELAGQPLLLLMLALYDLEGDALGELDAGLRRDQLYERLLHRFARREVVKHRPSLPERELARAVEEELRRLSVVAFAMFNRNSQWVTEEALGTDLRALLGQRQRAPADDFHAPLGEAEIVFGRFFFVHRARAWRHHHTLETYEFLHATFAEFLVARLTLGVLRELAAREAAVTLSLGAVDDDLLHALLSFSPLCVRAPAVGFLVDMLSDLAPDHQQALGDLLIRLFAEVHQPRDRRLFTGYLPLPLPVPARHAAYSANLLLLAVCVRGRVRATELYGDRADVFGRADGDRADADRPGVSGRGDGGRADVIDRWHAETLLWRSQLTTEGWTSLLRSLALERCHDGAGRRDVVLRRERRDALAGREPEPIEDAALPIPTRDLTWTFPWLHPGVTGTTEGAFLARLGPEQELLIRQSHFQCGKTDDVIHHAVEPLLTGAGALVLGAGSRQHGFRSMAHMLLGLMPSVTDTPPAAREAAYRDLVFIAAAELEREPRLRLGTALLDALRADREISGEVAGEIMRLLQGALTAVAVSDPASLRDPWFQAMAMSLRRCVIEHHTRGQVSDEFVAGLLGSALAPETATGAA